MHSPWEPIEWNLVVLIVKHVCVQSQRSTEGPPAISVLAFIRRYRCKRSLGINKFTLSSSLSASQRYFSAWNRPHSYWMKCRIPGSVILASPSCCSRGCNDPGTAPAAAAAAAAIAPVIAADVAWPGAALGPFGLRPAPLLLLPPPPPEFGFGPPPDLSASILTVQPFARIMRWKRAECTNKNNKKKYPVPFTDPAALHCKLSSFLPFLSRTEQNYYSVGQILHFRYHPFNIKHDLSHTFVATLLVRRSVCHFCTNSFFVTYEQHQNEITPECGN